ncbi:transcriptional regulator, MarR family [Novosphingobium aromaticivorans DSM 12444]|uniref:Transcriptional regulator, MarR family n=1 Tax=Novosphingobium aromaticivorans (strain ATCC 700278 / DSM 12444 / CCUG 56034 / CIP 105152 / NBRC 16084 / F199) TaxID=279238 RepID=Q2G8Y7_NOVAD|nr:winged helix DNA-binding protein [Novosphingobium aromaticivorans]ABD25686.1 transcriptional regulator, MarR family [Novosphingobium aromaticivorans DSM 12444]SCY00535.1 transcriptional regulator, MarR family [Novosphingobium aromaticivorans]
MTVRSMRATLASGRTIIAGRRSEPRTDGQVPAVAADTLDAATIACNVEVAREIYASRRRRHKFLPVDLFGEPTWDILLDLYLAAREDRRVPTTSACIGAHVPPTTALRWLRILEARGLVEREDDGRDGRRTFVRLTRAGLVAMDGCLANLHAGIRRAFGDGTSADARLRLAE